MMIRHRLLPPSFRWRPRVVNSWGAMLLGALACSGSEPAGSSPEPPPRGAGVFVLVDSVTLGEGTTVDVRAEVRDSAGNVVAGAIVTWATRNPAVASVNADGRVGGVAAGRTHVTAASGVSRDSAIVVVFPGGGTARLVLDPGTTYQTMLGWEATAQAGQIEVPSFPFYKDEVLRRAVNELGINRVRLEVQSGMENPVDWFQRFLDGQISFRDWAVHWYEGINDNADPNSANPAGFHFTAVDHTVDNVVNPMRTLVAANGEQLYVNLTFVDFKPTGLHRENPQEYAEYMLQAFLHLKQKYGWVPDGIEVILEPDNPGYTGTQIGRIIAATGTRLAAAGFTPRFTAPSTTSMGAAIPWFDELIAVPGARTFLRELSYHSYRDVSDAARQTIGQRALANGLDAAHLEKIGITYVELHKDLTLARNSSWSQFTIAWNLSDPPGDADDGGKYYVVDDRNPQSPIVALGRRTPFLLQYMRFVRRGAVRIEATSTSGTFQPLGFVHPDGRYVAVVKANGGGSFALYGLPAGRYGVRFTTSSQTLVDLPDAVLSPGLALKAGIPADGVITAYAR